MSLRRRIDIFKPMTFWAIGFCFLVGCVGPAPIDDYVLADAAIKLAKSIQADKKAPVPMAQAEEYYRRAILSYKNKDYQSAQKNFRLARRAADSQS
jgi:TolA-binding protein